MSNKRCGICNRVSSRDIETDIGSFTKNAFVADPSDNKHYICSECKEIHEELMLDYELKDGVWGWGEEAHVIPDKEYVESVIEKPDVIQDE